MLDRLRYIVIAIAVSASISLYAETPDISKVICNDSIISLHQPEKLAERVRFVGSKEHNDKDEDVDDGEPTAVQSGHVTERVVGYRVQVFSDNNIRTAKSEARAKAIAVSGAVPQYKTYVSYEAPFWRLRVGDFRSKADASEAADEIKRAFPQYSREIRVVRDRVNL